MASNLKTKDKYKKGDKVKYQIDYGASPMLAKSKAEKSKEKVGRITKATKDSITGKPKYVIDGMYNVYYTNVLGLAESKINEGNHYTVVVTRNKKVIDQMHTVGKNEIKDVVRIMKQDYPHAIISVEDSNGRVVQVENKINETLYLFATPGGKFDDWKWKSMWTNLKKVHGENEAIKIANELKNKPYHSKDGGYALVSSDGKTMKLVKFLENKQQGENTMKITKRELVEMIKSVVKEESEYQTFFKKKLGGRNLGQMSDEEKKAFFADVDKGWKGEKNETLEPVSQAAGSPNANPTQRLKAKKRDQMLAQEKVENYVRKVIREELKFVLFSEIPGGLSRKVAKKRISQLGSTDKSL